MKVEESRPSEDEKSKPEIEIRNLDSGTEN